MTRTRNAALVAAALPLAFVLAACGGHGGVAGASKTVQAKGRTVTATETEYRIQLSSSKLQPGQTTFEVVNKGSIGHALEIDGPGVSGTRTAGTIAPGSSMQLTVTLESGSYEIFCPVPGHKALGMDVHVTVGASAGNGMPGAGSTTTSNSGGSGY
jgi:uncharacterized cupredoxin-like copper-binding protein